jgi:translation initiation factor IF-3
LGRQSIPRDYRINQHIRVKEVRLVDDKGNQVGIVSLGDALSMSLERGLDLVEVAPNSVPPVCRILDYGKFRYAQSKKERESSKVQKGNLLREVRFRTRIGEHDRQSKTRLAKKLLTQGYKVKLSVMFRGREITHPDLGVKILRIVAEDLKEDARLDRTPTMEGRMMNIILSPNPDKELKNEKSMSNTGSKEKVKSAKT